VFTITPQQRFNQLRQIVHKLQAVFLKDFLVHNYFKAVTK